MLNIIALATVTFYLLAAITLWQRLKSSGTSTVAGKRRRRALLFIGLALLFHGHILHQALFSTEGLNLSLFAVLSLTAWIINLMILISAIWQPVENLGLFTLPITTLILVISLLLSPTSAPVQVSQGLSLHIILSITSYSLLSLAALQSLLLWVQERHLRTRRQLGGILGHLPALEAMESLLFQMIFIGHLLLTASLLTGIAYLEDIFAQHLVHKSVLSITAWLMFSILLWGRWHFGWRGKKAIRGTIAGFVVLMLSYFGSKLVLEVILKTS